MPVAFLLHKRDNGEFECCEDTRRACAGALATACRQDLTGVPVHLICTAGVHTNHNVVMSKQMQAVILSLDKKAPTVSLMGQQYNTQGELTCMIRFVNWLARIKRISPSDIHVTLVVKWWHAPRVCELMLLHWIVLCRRENLGHMPKWSVRPISSAPGWWKHARWEPKAMIMNLVRILRGKKTG